MRNFSFCLALAVLFFPFAETPQPAPVLGGKAISVPLGPSPVEVERRCSVPGEMEQCEWYCERIDKKRRPEPGWDPYAPIWLRSLAPTNPWALQQAVLSCNVRTIDGVMTLECRCFDPGTRT